MSPEKLPHASMRGSLLAFRQSSSSDVGTSATGGAGATAAGLRARALIALRALITRSPGREQALALGGFGDSKMYLYSWCKRDNIYIYIYTYIYIYIHYETGVTSNAETCNLSPVSAAKCKTVLASTAAALRMDRAPRPGKRMWSLPQVAGGTKKHVPPTLRQGSPEPVFWRMQMPHRQRMHW